MIEVLSLFTVSPLLLSAITQCMRTVSHKSLLHKLSSSFRTSITNQNNLKSILTFLCEERTRPCDFALSLPYWPATGYSCQNVFLSSVLALVIGGGCALIQAPLRSSLQYRLVVSCLQYRACSIGLVEINQVYSIHKSATVSFLNYLALSFHICTKSMA